VNKKLETSTLKHNISSFHNFKIEEITFRQYFLIVITLNKTHKRFTFMKPQKAQKIEKITGYVLLIIGLIFIILPACLALWMFLSGTQIPQLIPIPAVSEGEFVRAFAIFCNVCVALFVFIIMVWAGSIISSRGVTMVKDVKLKLVRRNLAEATEAIDKEEAERA
jgi:sterol desaturase/sphingolipid hydroxylase (fatty acid hydroxylase superfamily)